MELANVSEEHENVEGEDSFENYEMSISDKLYVGYHSMDRATQTVVTEIVELGKVSEILFVLLRDVADLKKSLYYAKLTLQAEYDMKLERCVMELYSLASRRVTELEAKHKERIDVVRRSYRTQLANAISKLSKEYHDFYDNRNEHDRGEQRRKKELANKEAAARRRSALAKQEMMEMMQRQLSMKESVPSTKPSTVTTTGYFEDEIVELKECIEEQDARISYLEDLLEESNKENERLNGDISTLTKESEDQQKQIIKLHDEVMTTRNKMMEEQKLAETKLAEQETSLRAEMGTKVNRVMDKMQKETEQKLNSLKAQEAGRLKAQKKLEAQRLQDMQKVFDNQNAQKEPVPVTDDTARLQEVEHKLSAEVQLLTRELAKSNRMWLLKTKILSGHIHSLKDEMFLRNTLQQKAAKLGQVAVTYVDKVRTPPLAVQPVKNMAASQIGNNMRVRQLPAIISGPHQPQTVSPGGSWTVSPSTQQPTMRGFADVATAVVNNTEISVGPADQVDVSDLSSQNNNTVAV